MLCTQLDCRVNHVRYRVEHSKRNSVSPSNHVLFFYYINILLTRRSRLNSRFKKRTRCHSFMAVNRTSDMSPADWLSQTDVKKYRNFSPAVIRFFSVVEVPIKHSSLYNKISYLDRENQQSEFKDSFPLCLEIIQYYCLT